MGKIEIDGMDTRVIEFHRRNRHITGEEIDAHRAQVVDDAAEGEDSETVFSSSYNDRHYAEGAGTDADA